MSFSIKTNDKTNEKISILNKEQNKDFNEIKLIKRTLENNTHEVIEDTRLKRITSWRKSQRKFCKNLIYNILSLGILHIISLYYPNLYIKLYCNPCEGKDCDYFLVEDIYGYYTLCLKRHKKGKNKRYDYESSLSKESFISLNNTPGKIEFYLSKNLTYSFKYKSMTYEYNDETNEIIPVYMNLSKITNKGIINYFSEGLSFESKVMKFKERYGLNEYYINPRLIFLYIFKVEIPNFIIILLNSIVEIFLRDYFSFATKFLIVIIVSFIEYTVIKRIAGKFDNKEYTIDGQQNEIKVKRKYLIKNENDFYIQIKNIDLLPGDILFLKSNDIVPCDCLILEGECIVNESNLTGNLDIFKKISLKNNNEKFNYKINNICILFHGMKIMKTVSKLKEGFISVLCINTGPNTFKANQYSNILYLSERIKDYNLSYTFFGGERKSTFIGSIIVFLLSILLGIGYIFLLQMKLLNIRLLIASILIRSFCKSLMPTFYITNSIIILLSIIRLECKNIFCYDKSKLLSNSGKIDTIFFSKIGTLCTNKFEVNGYYPAYIDPKRGGAVNYKIYGNNQIKEMNIQLLNYYKEYMNSKLRTQFNLRGTIRKQQNKFTNKKNELMALFMECLLSCNNIDKFNTEIYGNLIETEIFNEMKWDIKMQDSNEAIYSNIKEDISNLNIKNENSLLYNNKIIVIDQKIYDIFPKNYYKINENCRNEMIKRKLTKNIFDNFIRLEKGNTNNRKSSRNSISSAIKQNNKIMNDINTCQINSYKIRIYKRFIINGTLNTSAIVYNFMTKELRFMIKGMAEEIIEICDKNTLPENFSKVISNYRRKGYIIIICATKMLNIDEYNELNGYEFYLNNLIFCGFITLQSQLKETIQKSLNDLKKMNCRLIITSGDNEYNCLSIGFSSGVIDNKNIFVFDKEDNNKIMIRKIFNVKNLNQYDDDINNENLDSKSNYEKFSQNNSKKNIAKYNNSIIDFSQTKNSNYENKVYTNPSRDKEWKTPKIKNKMYFKKKKEKRRSYLNEIDDINKFNNTLKNERYLNNSPFNLSTTNQNEEIEKLSTSRPNNKQKKQTKKYQDSNSHKKSENSHINSRNGLGEFEKIYFYPGIFKKYEELKDNCIYCVSGKVINYLYKNIRNKYYKHLLQLIHKNCKIFFSMKAIDKSISTDFYRKYRNSYICNIGECQSDFDPIMASSVGINLKEPKNFNTILCHFYAKHEDIICIKNIIMEGKIVDENISLLKISSYFCTMIINSYILTCFIRNNDVIIGQLNILELILLVFSLLAFTGRPDNHYLINPLVKNMKLFNYYYYTQIVGLFIMKLMTIYFSSWFYKTNFDLEIEKLDKIFCTYYFILSIELIFSIVISFNFISFSKKNLASRMFLSIFFLLLFLYFINLISLNSSNFKCDFLNISIFEYSNKLFDSFDDRNKVNLGKICTVDLFFTLIYTRVVYFTYYKIAKYKEKNQNK